MKTLSTLQAYRAFAAGIVVLSHASSIYAHYFSRDVFHFFFRMGNAGVAFFFVLSGFIMAWVHEKDFEKKERLGGYFRKRFLRIYPIYWFVTLVMVPFWLAVPAFGRYYHKEFGALVKSLLLFPQSHTPHLSVGWTLTHEVLFYLMFALFFFSRRLGAVLMLVWPVAVLVAHYTGFNATFPAIYFFGLLNLLFPLGILAALVTRRLPALKGRAGLITFVVGNALFALFLALDQTTLRAIDGVYLYGLASVLILAGAMNVSVEEFFSKRKALLFLGSASYALYLIHAPALSVAGKVFSASGRWMGAAGDWPRAYPLAGYLALTGAALLAGSLLHVCIERPLQGWLGQKIVKTEKTAA
jgi:exopolysaccharide production protein ExoZ